MQIVPLEKLNEKKLNEFTKVFEKNKETEKLLIRIHFPPTPFVPHVVRTFLRKPH